MEKRKDEDKKKMKKNSIRSTFCRNPVNLRRCDISNAYNGNKNELTNFFLN